MRSDTSIPLLAPSCGASSSPLSPFLCSGAEAIDNAIKIARSFTGRPNIIAFDVRDLGGGGGGYLLSPRPWVDCLCEEGGVHIIPVKVYDILLSLSMGGEAHTLSILQCMHSGFCCAPPLPHCTLHSYHPPPLPPLCRRAGTTGARSAPWR